MTEEVQWGVCIDLPKQWDQIDADVLTDEELCAVLGVSFDRNVGPNLAEDLVLAAVLSELIEDDDGNPIGALSASLVAVLAPPEPASDRSKLERDVPFGPPVDGIQAVLHMVCYRVPLPEVNSDLVMEFATPNLPFQEDLVGLFDRIAASARCEPL